ncbi:MAG TPA: type II toxin-antitoxin system VapC family toxin [Verrucomicrobiota bacterium]|nr:type II toxin-antitoxin system VapC family toxin [Verrucomicrobiota bacterium]
MAWVVDTCLLIDVAEADPTFGLASARLLDSKRRDGLTICPTSYIELAPVFNGDQTAQNEFLFNLGVTWPEVWTHADTEEAHRAWQRYVTARRTTKVPKRPLADILIGAFASRFDGILTRNESDFRTVFASLSITTP